MLPEIISLLLACAEKTALTESWERQRGQAKVPLVVPMEGCADKTSLRTDPLKKGWTIVI